VVTERSDGTLGRETIISEPRSGEGANPRNDIYDFEPGVSLALLAQPRLKAAIPAGSKTTASSLPLEKKLPQPYPICRYILVDLGVPA
jgi:hypothetical protein